MTSSRRSGVVPEAPLESEGPVRRAYELAVERRAPVFVSQRPFVDDRGWSVMNQFREVLRPEGQINFSIQHPGVVKAWHRHALQTDFWICLLGHLKVGVYREEDEVAWSAVLGEKRLGVLIIPPTLWHGAATMGSAPAGLLYYVTHAYDPDRPDEDRRPPDSVPGFPWQPVNR